MQHIQAALNAVGSNSVVLRTWIEHRNVLADRIHSCGLTNYYMQSTQDWGTSFSSFRPDSVATKAPEGGRQCDFGEGARSPIQISSKSCATRSFARDEIDWQLNLGPESNDGGCESLHHALLL